MRSPRTRLSPVAAVVLVAALLAGALPGGGRAQEGGGFPDAGSAPAAAAEAPPPGGVIVALKEGVAPGPLLRRLGVAPTHVYERVFNGFAADLPPAALAALRREPGVERVSPDVVVFATGQVEASAPAQKVPTGVDRIDADRNPRADIDGEPGPVAADIAVLDTGISPNHPDLNVAGGRNCTGRDRRGWADDNGHGTHVAGTAAAEDDKIGVVGVAPGARLWAVKVLNARGFGRGSEVVCGLEWVLAHGRIDVVNMSLSGYAPSRQDGPCQSNNFHRAVCAVVEAGIPVVVSAGNDGQDVSRIELPEGPEGPVQAVPAAWEETIAVSSFNDYDGRPGGAAEPTCVPERFREFYPDDAFTRFSNHGPDVDIAAPGVCIRSTWKRGGYAVLSGTSMAAPHVAGAVALLLADRPNASVIDVRSWLRGTASVPQRARFGFAGDPDRYHEPVLYLGPGDGGAAGA